MSTLVSTIAERARYQTDERALLADRGVVLPDEAACRECGCSQSLACPQGCGWAQPDLCSVCAAELEQFGELLDPSPAFAVMEDDSVLCSDCAHEAGGDGGCERVESVVHAWIEAALGVCCRWCGMAGEG